MKTKKHHIKITLFAAVLIAPIGCAQDYSQKPASSNASSLSASNQPAPAPAVTTTTTTHNAAVHTSAAPAPATQRTSVQVVAVTPTALPAPSAPAASPYNKPGFATFVEDGRLWVFRDGTKELAQFKEHGEPAKVVIRPGAGPNRMTVKSVDAETIDAYMLAKPGFATFVEDGRLWVFRDGSKELAQFKEHGEPAKVVIRPGAGPNRMTVKSVDTETIDAYLTTKPGFVTFIEDGRLWVFRDGTKELAQFKEHGEPAKVVIRPGAGPNRMTIKSVDAETIDAYLTSKPGFVTFIEDGRLWVFRDGTKELAQFREHGEPAKVVIRPGAGPNRMTVKSVDAATIDAYLTAGS